MVPGERLPGAKRQGVPDGCAVTPACATAWPGSASRAAPGQAASRSQSPPTTSSWPRPPRSPTPACRCRSTTARPWHAARVTKTSAGHFRAVFLSPPGAMVTLRTHASGAGELAVGRDRDVADDAVAHGPLLGWSLMRSAVAAGRAAGIVVRNRMYAGSAVPSCRCFAGVLPGQSPLTPVTLRGLAGAAGGFPRPVGGGPPARAW
jgi:hypothetical protein